MIIIDKNMPLLNGIETTMQIRSWEAEGKIAQRTFLVLSSGEELHQSEHKLLFDYIISKPINKRSLENILHQLQYI